MAKPKFEDVYYDPDSIRWGMGNYVVGPNLIATIKLRELNKKEEKKLKSELRSAKDVYEKYINKGQCFRPIGEKANEKIEAKITFINPTKQSVTWKQYNMTNEETSRGCKPAAGKWSINAMLVMQKNKEIEFIEQNIKK